MPINSYIINLLEMTELKLIKLQTIQMLNAKILT